MGKVAYTPRLFVAVAATNLGALQYGYALGVINTMMSDLSSDLDFNRNFGGALIVSAILLGASIGAMGGGYLADYFGPRKAQLYNTFILILGGVLCCSAPHSLIFGGNTFAVPWVLLLGRVVVGLGAGAASLYTPRYLAEISPPKLRGAFGTSFQILINVGILFSYLIGLPFEYGLSTVTIFGTPIHWWRVMFFVAIIPAMLQFVLFLFCPESPVWLSWKGMKGLSEKAQGSLWEDEEDLEQSLLPKSKGLKTSMSVNDLADEDVVEEMHQGDREEGSVSSEVNDDAVSLGSALTQKRYRWMVALAIGVPLFSQLSGINTVVFYSSEVFKTAGLESPIMGSVFTALVNVLVTIGASIMMDNYGRKKLILWSHAGMAFGLFGLALANSKYAASIDGMSHIALAFVLFYVMCFAIGAGPVPWVYLSEILPENIKGAVGGFATAQCWVANLLIGLTFPAMLSSIHLFGSYLLYTAFNALGFLFAYGLMVETKQKTLHQITHKLLLKD